MCENVVDCPDCCGGYIPKYSYTFINGVEEEVEWEEMCYTCNTKGFIQLPLILNPDYDPGDLPETETKAQN